MQLLAPSYPGIHLLIVSLFSSLPSLFIFSFLPHLSFSSSLHLHGDAVCSCITPCTLPRVLHPPIAAGSNTGQ